MTKSKLRRLSSAVVVLVLVVASLVPGHAAFAAAANEQWVGTWATAPVAQAPNATVNINNQTLRQIVHTSIGGDRVRVKLSNALGTAPLVIGAAHVAPRDAGELIASGSGAPLTFSGSPSITIPAGAVVLSDPADVRVPPLSDLAIDVYLPGDTGATTSPLTRHSGALQTNYVSPAGNYAGVVAFPVASTRTSWYFLTGVDVRSGKQTQAIAALGNSITDGTASTPNTNNRWPDHLARRLLEGPGNNKLGVLNLGIAGNRVLTDGAGPNAQARLERDVLTQTGVKHVIVLEGINDIGFQNFFPDQAVSAAQIIAGHRQIIARVRALGLKIYGSTLTPVEGSGYFGTDTEAKRQAVNEWIRTSGEYDAVIDFDLVTRDPSRPTRFLPLYDSGDHLHPSNAGYEAMAGAIDLKLFK
jgi:lysophospholipase L1-like esterase